MTGPQQVDDELAAQAAVFAVTDRSVDDAHQRCLVLQHGGEHRLACQNVRLPPLASELGQCHVSVLDGQQSQHGSDVDQREQVVHLE